jgi:hypothetical protein
MLSDFAAALRAWAPAFQALRVVGGACLPSVFFESHTNVGKVYLDHLEDLRS